MVTLFFFSLPQRLFSLAWRPLKFSAGQSKPLNFSTFKLTGLEPNGAPSSGVVAVEKKKLKRAVLETLLVHSGMTANYWSTYGNWIEDWQFELTWEDQRKKWFTSEGNRLDSNCFVTNAVHLLHGAAFFNFSRTNHLDWRASFLFALAGSLAWEYTTEWREIVAINDNLATTFGGLAVGEGLFQLASHFDRRPGLANRVLSFIFDPILSLNNWLDKKANRPSRTGFIAGEDGRHDIRFFLGQQNVGDNLTGEPTSRFNFGFEGQLVRIPEYGQPGQSKRWIKDTLFSELFAETTVSGEGFEEISAHTRSVLCGFFQQRLIAQANDQPRGTAFYVGLGSGIEFYKKRSLIWYDSCPRGLSDPRFERPRPLQFSDKLTVVNIAGPEFHLTRFRPRLTIGINAGLSLDFAMINSLALNRYSLDHPVGDIKTTLMSWGYYYGWGYTARVEFQVGYDHLELNGRISYQRYDSIEGLDRFQDLVSDDFNIIDSRLVYKLNLGIQLPRTPVKAMLALEGVERHGRIKDVAVREFEPRVYYQLCFLF